MSQSAISVQQAGVLGWRAEAPFPHEWALHGEEMIFNQPEEQGGVAIHLSLFKGRVNLGSGVVKVLRRGKLEQI